MNTHNSGYDVPSRVEARNQHGHIMNSGLTLGACMAVLTLSLRNSGEVDIPLIEASASHIAEMMQFSRFASGESV